MGVWYYMPSVSAIGHLISYVAAVPSILHTDEAYRASRLSEIFSLPLLSHQESRSETPRRYFREERE